MSMCGKLAEPDLIEEDIQALLKGVHTKFANEISGNLLNLLVS